MPTRANQGWGFWEYVPGYRYPVQATLYTGKDIPFRMAGLALNFVREHDALVRNRVILPHRKIAPKGPVMTGKEGMDAGSI